MELGQTPIGRTLLLALLGLPIALIAGIYWRCFPPSRTDSPARPALNTAPIVAEASVKV